MPSIAEVDLYFNKESGVHKAARSISQELESMGIAFAIAGALAANSHGYLRATSDVDLLLCREDLRRFKERNLGRGYVEVFPGSKAMRDTRNNVKIDVLLVGDYPGDGKPKPITFPEPAQASSIDGDGLRVLKLEPLLELKLASGMTAPHRPQDLADVIQLIKVNHLPPNFRDRLHLYVHEKFDELWQYAQINEDY